METCHSCRLAARHVGELPAEKGHVKKRNTQGLTHREALQGGLAAGATLAAWSKGMRERRVVVKHALKNAVIPVITIIGIEIGQVAGGTVVYETIFGLPGMGRFMLDAINQRDYPVVQGVNLLLASIIIFVNLLVDLTYAYLDPRIRYQ